MGNFSNNAITDLGKMLLADMQAGAVFTPTRIVMGSGSMPGGATAQSMTDVITPVKSLVINRKKRTPDGKCVFGGVYTNEEVTSPFYFRELALYAKAVYYNVDGSVKSETAEILYSYGNAGATADYMPAYSTSTVVEKQMDIVVWVGNDTQVDLTIESGVYITHGHFDSHAARHAIGGEDPITPTSIGAVPLDGSESITGRSLYINNYHAQVGANESRAVLNSYDVAGDNDSYRGIAVLNKNDLADISRALCFAVRDLGVGEVLYRIYGEHNKPTPAEISAAPAGHVTKVYQAYTDEDITNAMLDAYAATANASVGYFVINVVLPDLMLLGGHWHMIIYRRDTEYGTFELISYDARTTRKMTRSMYRGVLQAMAWDNPPMTVDVEYRTTERFHDEAVYKKNDAMGNILWRKESENAWRLLSSASYVSPATVE